ncbi:chemotaxis protein CheW [Fibrobacterota bacterium]
MVLSKFTRIVREMSRSLGKDIRLDILGTEVELDKSIIETISDPMTHLVRNAVDHGIETPEERRAMGKNPQGNLLIRAFHQDGQVHIKIKDDGRGMDPGLLRRKAVEKGIITSEQADSMNERDTFNLVFEAGLSTAEKVTQISGRGVGMDVVKTGFQKLGGSIELSSRPGEGTTITVKLPLTLAIMPALIVSVEDNCYAIPQLNIHEVVWLHGADTWQSIHDVDGKEILWLRDKPIPLLRLSELLEIKKTFTNPDTGEKLPDPRSQSCDRRQASAQPKNEFRKGLVERRVSEDNSVSIVIVRLGSERMGVIADKVVDTEELVVKPFHERLKDCNVFTGTAVLGDSRIAMILDIESLARLGSIEFEKLEHGASLSRSPGDEEQAVILFDIGGREQFAVPLYLISRVQEISTSEIQIAKQREYLDFRDKLIPLVRPECAIPAFEAGYRQDCVNVIIPRGRRPIGILAANILDTVEMKCCPDPGNFNQPGILGSQLIEGKLTLFLDIFSLISQVEPGWFTEGIGSGALRLLLVDDTPFYQSMLSSYLQGVGVETTVAGNGREALELMQQSAFNAVISDLDMPVMDGLEFIRHIRKDQRFKDLPVLAISSYENDAMRSRALDNGFDDFRSKLVPEELLNTIISFTTSVKSGTHS